MVPTSTSALSITTSTPGAKKTIMKDTDEDLKTRPVVTEAYGTTASGPTLGTTFGTAFLRRLSREERSTENKTRTEVTCKDAPAEAEQGVKYVLPSFELRGHLDALSYNSSVPGKSIHLQILINKPSGSSDMGSITINVDYQLVDLEETLQTNASDISICDDRYRLCSDRLSCVHQDHICDQNKDCRNNVDEKLWCRKEKCPLSTYMCSTGECIRLHRLCDGVCDCSYRDLCEDETLMCRDRDAKENLVFRKAPEEEFDGFQRSVNWAGRLISTSTLTMLLPTLKLFGSWLC